MTSKLTTSAAPSDGTVSAAQSTPSSAKIAAQNAAHTAVPTPGPAVFQPASLPSHDFSQSEMAVLQLQDGSVYQGFSFGARKSVAGECVFQTGMVGYSESLTDPSYRGQILVLTYPLVGNYGVPSRQALDVELQKLAVYFESNRIHVAALVVARLSEDYSHYLAKSSLGQWLQENDVPAIYGIDTRALTKKIRNQGVMLGKLLQPVSSSLRISDIAVDVSVDDCLQLFQANLPWSDPNASNLVAEVSTKTVIEYSPKKDVALKKADGSPFTVLAVDVGMKYNQIRCFTSRGVKVRVVPWDFDFTKTVDYDGLFISNGPGDPSTLTVVIERLRVMLERKVVPTFGICLGHQLLALASGAKTSKMKYGNRGHNIPCTDLESGRCYITSQNHGYAVDTSTLGADWAELFVNANDASNEGIIHRTLPYFSVQFHPESTPGPRDTEYLFDRFISIVQECSNTGKLVQIKKPEYVPKATRVHVKKVLILGSGGLSIGQAGEFDYSGSQAIKALKEEGIYTVLINPNIATIQTSKGLADKVYFLPVNPEFVRKVIQHERPDGIYVSFGGQTALNCGVKMKDEFEQLGVKVLGTPIDTVIVTEDRDLFAQAMAEIHEKCAASASAVNVKESVAAANKIGYPVIVRAAYALGGLGSGFAYNESELVALCNKAFALSPQVLIERSMKGWKEIEYEVVRDINNNCITVCNMENFDPLGIHTGDSIVVAPSQTLSDEDYNMLRTTAVNVIRHLGVVGECNIQYALNPDSKEYCIIEVNARLSRSSALASKATGYPLAFVAAKLGLGIPLSELKNSVTKVTCACFEPSLDYCVVKIPRWDLKKFNRVSTKVGSAMKSVGEVMAIGRNFEETIQKAIRSIDTSYIGFTNNNMASDIEEELKYPSDQRLFAIASALHSGKYTVDRIWELTRIDKWFLSKLKNIVDLDKRIAAFNAQNIPALLLRQAKQLGFSDRHVGVLLGTSEISVRKIRQNNSIMPFVKQIDTVAAEFPSYTNYLYLTYNAVEHDILFNENGVMVLGSGVYRIGSSVEFDWCAVRTVRTLREHGFKTIMVNYNPETVSTDYDEADRLYFVNITLENVLDVYDLETSAGVFVSMGGQTPNNIALSLHRQNVRIFGTSPEQIDGAENRYKFSRMCDTIGVDQPRWKELTSLDESRSFCDNVGFPVLVRPSYVLSGAAMNVVYSSEDLENYLKQAVAVSQEHPVVISKFIEDAKEIEMDAIAHEGKLIYHVVSEHVENAGVHSGDATLILPPQDLEPETVRKIIDATKKIGNALNVTGPFNIQFIAKNNEIKVIECNVRASRSFPFVSKVLGVDMIELATKAMIGLKFETNPVPNIPASGYVAVKVPQFSFSRLSGADPVLGVEMASTGEVACFGADKFEAYMKALLSTGFVLPKKNILLSIGSFKEKQEMLPVVWKLHRAGFNIFATSGTADFMSEHGIPVHVLEAFETSNAQQKPEYSLMQHLSNNLIDLYINLPSRNKYRRPASYVSKGYMTRRMAVDLSVPLITNVKCAKIFIEALCRHYDFKVTSLDYQTSHTVVSLPGVYNVAMFCPNVATDLSEASNACIRAGITFMSVLPNGSNVVAFKNTFNNYMPLLNVTCATPADDNTPVFVGMVNDRVNIKELSMTLRTFDGGVKLVTNTSGESLASVLFLANLHKSSVHVCNVAFAQDLEMIILSKQNGISVTCDVSVYNLFLSRKDYPKSNVLGTEADVEYLWNNLDAIDCFSTGTTPYLLAKEILSADKIKHASYLGVEEMLPLLFDAVNKGRLTAAELEARIYTNPRKIFNLPVNKTTLVEVEIDRTFVIPSEGCDSAKCGWSPFAGRKLKGAVSRLIINSQVVYVDGEVPHNLEYRGQLVTPLPVESAIIQPKDVSPVRMRKLSRMSSMSTETAVAAHMSSLAPIEQEKDGRYEGLGVQLEPLEKSVSQTRMKDVAVPLSRPAEALFKYGQTIFFRQHILSVRQFTRAELHILFNAAHEMRTLVERNGAGNILAGKVSCNLFYEPSTRTSASFETAMLRLGGQVINITPDTSSVKKGETLTDTVKTVGCYADVVVLRHPEKGSVSLAARSSPVPVINAGDGIGEHPTQAFLDVFTIREELGTVNGLTITIIGDLKNGRTVHSLVKVLSLYDVRLNYVSPESLKLPDDVKSDVDRKGLVQVETSELTESLLARTDVLYVTRIQKERFASIEEYNKVKDSFIVTSKTLLAAKPSMIVMHPLPRVNEIDPDVDFDQRAAYFRQVKYGLFVRMALLALVMTR